MTYMMLLFVGKKLKGGRGIHKLGVDKKGGNDSKCKNSEVELRSVLKKTTPFRCNCFFPYQIASHEIQGPIM